MNMQSGLRAVGRKAVYVAQLSYMYYDDDELRIIMCIKNLASHPMTTI